MNLTDARTTYQTLTDAYEQVRDIWTRKVCPECFGRLDPKDATPAWPKCECHPSTRG